MKQLKIGPGFAVFVLFFGIALLEAFWTQSWLMVIFWILIGAVFILLENRGKPGVRKEK